MNGRTTLEHLRRISQLEKENFTLAAHQCDNWKPTDTGDWVCENKARKPLGIQEARNLVNQMLSEEISFGRFVELINEGGK